MQTLIRHHLIVDLEQKLCSVATDLGLHCASRSLLCNTRYKWVKDKSPIFAVPWWHLSHDMTKPTKCVCAQWRLRSAWASAQSDQSLHCSAQWVAKDPRFLHADSEDSDQTGPMPRLIWVFAGHTPVLLVLSCCGSFEPQQHLVTKPTKWLCAQQRLRSAWASTQSDQSLRCALNG